MSHVLRSADVMVSNLGLYILGTLCIWDSLYNCITLLPINDSISCIMYFVSQTHIVGHIIIIYTQLTC